MLETRIAQGRLDAVPRYIDAAHGATKRASCAAPPVRISRWRSWARSGFGRC
jgi:hypothetical protein